ncbi:MAG TPA: FxLYD domain-containing protein [Candidatus Nitrosocosmicus sp.]|nr:FxLYD domain-containing protein [Candidatus Nitrosocosmicus sp.]
MEKNSSDHFLAFKTLEYLFFPSFTIILLSLLFCIIVQTSSGYTEGDVLKVISMKLTQDQYNYKHLIGILQNNANKTVNNVIISANFFDKTNKSIGNFSKQSEITTINPREITPFDILIYNKDLNDKINKFSITVKYNFTNHKDEKIAMESSNSHIDIITGFYFIDGKIKNNGQLYSNNTTIIAITYDKNKDLAGVWKAQTEPYNIPPSTEASFSIPVTDKIQSYNILNYTLLVESNKYVKTK